MLDRTKDTIVVKDGYGVMSRIYLGFGKVPYGLNGYVKSHNGFSAKNLISFKNILSWNFLMVSRMVIRPIRFRVFMRFTGFGIDDNGTDFSRKGEYPIRKQAF